MPDLSESAVANKEEAAWLGCSSCVSCTVGSSTEASKLSAKLSMDLGRCGLGAYRFRRCGLAWNKSRDEWRVDERKSESVAGSYDDEKSPVAGSASCTVSYSSVSCAAGLSEWSAGSERSSAE